MFRDRLGTHACGHWYEGPLCRPCALAGARRIRRVHGIGEGTVPSPGVAPERVAELRAMYLDGTLSAYCDVLLGDLIDGLARALVVDELL